MAYDSDYNCKVLEDDYGCDCAGCYCGGFIFDTTTTTNLQSTTTTTTEGTTTTSEPFTTTTVYIDEQKFAICRTYRIAMPLEL